MSLNQGATLGPYEIIEQIGAGGMGEVYRARDTRLGRDVAVKVSAQQFSERFEREARAIAALNHPNICTVHDVGPNYLVLELLDGPTLSDRIKEGSIPLEEALGIARQIAIALEAAHERGIVHRDLKPGNVKIKPDGTVKVLDFGLAKVGGASGPRAISEDSPTMSMAATQAGVVLGTAAYMAPEQARGKEVDKRADIWAFGVVLYEMLTGKRPFTGDDLGEVLASVIKEEPRWVELPERVRPLIQRCLAKDPAKRLRDLGDIDLLLNPATVEAKPSSATSMSNRYVWPGIAAAALILMAGVGFVHLRERKPAAPAPVKFTISPPEGVTFGSYLTLSPDGTKLAFTGTGSDGRTRIYIRNLDALEARVLPGTENGASPQWSPDSQFILFGDGGKLKKMAVAGGPPQTLCEVEGVVGRSSWGKEGVILFANRGANPGVWKVSASGGIPVFVSKTNPNRKETLQAFPVFLPDQKHFLYLVISRDENVSGIYVGSIDLRPEQQSTERLVATNSSFLYVSSEDPDRERLLFLRDRMIVSQRLDLSSYKLTGDATPVSDARISLFGSYAMMSASVNGALAYRGGDSRGGVQLSWFDRQGKNLGKIREMGSARQPSFSPDGTRVAYMMDKDGTDDVWVYDLARENSTRLTFSEAVGIGPLWSADGRFIIWGNRADEIRQKQSNGVGEERVVWKQVGGNPVPHDVTRDGHSLIYSVFLPKTQATDLWVLPLSAGAQPTPYIAGDKFENQARFSPDGRWVAYASDESGRAEVYVQPFPANRDGGGKWMISSGGGLQPLWKRDGTEIYYIGPNGEVMMTTVQTAPTFRPGSPKLLFTNSLTATRTSITSRVKPWDVSPDGQRFLMTMPSGSDSETPVTVVLNWQSESKN